MHLKGLNCDFADHLNFGILQLLEFQFVQPTNITTTLFECYAICSSHPLRVFTLNTSYVVPHVSRSSKIYCGLKSKLYLQNINYDHSHYTTKKFMTKLHMP